MLRFFERFLEPTAHSPNAPPPVLGSPQALIRFYWHFVRQIPGPLAALFATGFCVAITDALIPVCLGRIVSLVSSTAPEALWPEAGGDVLSISGIWYILVFGVIAIGLLSAADWRLSLPIVAWFVLYVIVLGRFLPQMRERSREMSEMRSVLTGKIVDSYTKNLTVKLFARAREEDA